MPTQPPNEKALFAEKAELRTRLEEAEETLRAIRNGEVDALVVQTSAGSQIYTLQGQDAELNRFRGEILEQINDAVIVLDGNQHITYLNVATEQQYDIAAFKALGHHVAEVYQCRWLHPDDEALMLATLNETGHWRGENAHVKRNGETIHVESTVTLMHASDGTQSGMLLVVRDITERKRMEEELRESRQDFVRAQEVGQIGWWHLDTTKDVLTWSDENYRIFGVPKGMPLSYESFLNIVHPDDRDFVHVRWMAGLAGEPYDLEHRIVVGDVVKWVREKAYLEFGEDGVLLGGFGVTQDITDRKQAEIALKDADRQKDEFLAMLGHELRNPLTPISNIAQMLGSQPLTGTALTKASEMLNRNVAHISHLVDDLLDVSRITRGLVKINRQRIELVGLLKETSESVQTLRHSKQQTIKFDFPNQPIYLDGDPVRLTQVFTNLLTNAVKYTGEGGLIALVVNIEGLSVVVHVRDNGMGIEPQLLPHIFSIFTQGERGLARSEGGLGLGLTLVKKLVELHSGQVTAYSQGINQGSEFVVQLPIVVEETAQAEPMNPQALTSPSSQGLRVLMIDDNEDVVDSISLFLEMSGHQVEAASNGTQGIVAAQNFAPDIILLDIGLPDMDGYQVARKLREQPCTQGVPIIAMSGYSPGKSGHGTDAAGFDRYLIKPPKLSELQNLISEYQRLKHGSE